MYRQAKSMPARGFEVQGIRLVNLLLSGLQCRHQKHLAVSAAEPGSGVLCCAVLCYAMPCCHAVPCCAMLRHAVLCRAVLCCAVL